MSGARCKAAICCRKLTATVEAVEKITDEDFLSDSQLENLAAVAERAADAMTGIVLEDYDEDD